MKHRVNDLQKYKEFIDKEFKIVGGYEGVGTDKGCVVFEVINEDGNVFHVRPKGSVAQRKRWFQNLKDIIGKELTVRYQELSEDGIPIFPVGVVIRDYE